MPWLLQVALDILNKFILMMILCLYVCQPVLYTSALQHQKIKPLSWCHTVSRLWSHNANPVHFGRTWFCIHDAILTLFGGQGSKAPGWRLEGQIWARSWVKRCFGAISKEAHTFRIVPWRIGPENECPLRCVPKCVMHLTPVLSPTNGRHDNKVI